MIAYFTHTEPGGHEKNEDRLEVVPLRQTVSGYLCALADGQGGQAGGAEAAEIACRNCVGSAASFSLDQLLSPLTWPTILRQSDEMVANNPQAGFTTLIGFCLTETAVCGASSGDSAVLLMNAGKRPLVLTGQQYKNPPVGCGAAVFMPFASPLIAPWTVLAMTDGVWKYAGWDTLFAVTESDRAEAILHRVHAKAVLPASAKLQDDFSLVVFQGRV